MFAITGHYTSSHKILTPQWKSDCCMRSIVQAGQILGSAGNRDKVYSVTTENKN